MASVDAANNDNMEGNEATSIEHRRLTNYFHTVISQTVEKYFSTCLRFSLFKEKYSDWYAQDPQEVREVYEQLKKQLQAYVRDDLEAFCANIAPTLHTLDDIIAKNEDRKGQTAWRPTDNPEEDIRSHLYPEKVKHRDNLLAFLQRLRGENLKLEETVMQNHKSILDIRKRIDSALRLEGKHYDDLRSSVNPILNNESNKEN